MLTPLCASITTASSAITGASLNLSQEPMDDWTLKPGHCPRYKQRPNLYQLNPNYILLQQRSDSYAV